MILLFPYMRAASLSALLPEGVRLFCPGLEDQLADQAWRPDTLPFAPAEARHVLRDLKAYAEELAGRSRTSGGALDQTGEELARRKLRHRVARGDEEALRHLGVPAGPAGDLAAEARVRAQKVLLLALDLEDQCLEARDLAKKFGADRAGLPNVVGVEQEEKDAPDEFSEMAPFTPDLPGDPGALVLNVWERVLEAMSIFAPAGTIFWAGHPTVAETLKERGLLFEKGGPGDAPDGAEFATAPLGQILGRTASKDFNGLGGREAFVITIAAAGKQA